MIFTKGRRLMENFTEEVFIIFKSKISSIKANFKTASLMDGEFCTKKIYNKLNWENLK
jgi:hypothetical protein